MHQKVIKMTGDLSKKLEITLKNMQSMKENVEVEDENDVSLKNADKPKKERKNVKVKSLKKQVAAISGSVKEKIAA